MSVMRLLSKFFRSQNWGVFFIRFFLFSAIAVFIWSTISIHYGRFLCNRVETFERNRGLPILDVRYTDQHGLSMIVTLAPAKHAPVPLKQEKTVEVKIFPNTLHFNIIPFLALILASPFRSYKRLLTFLIIGSVIMLISHLIHLHLNIDAYYFKQQSFMVDKMRMSPEKYQEAITYLYFMRLVVKLQGFMEQAGSMIVPAFIWMVYAQEWLFASLLKNRRQKMMKQNQSD